MDVEAIEDGANDVVAWSSTHLSEDDSDEDDPSSSRSPSRSDGSVSHADNHPNDSGEDVGDDCMEDVDVDLPDGSSPQSSSPKATRVASGTLTAREEQAAETYVRASEPMVSASAEPSPLKEEAKPRLVSQIPRLAPPLARKFSLNAAPSPPGSPSPPRLQRSPSKISSSPGKTAQQSEVSPASPVRRGQSVYVPQSMGRTRGIVSTSSQFWANEQNRRSSRLLDEWKRKEIWHDFKRAEENVLTNPPTTTAAPPRDVLLEATGSLDDVLQGIRSDMLSKARPPLRRATSFASKSGLSPEKPLQSTDDEIPMLGGDAWQTMRAAMVVPLTKTPLTLDTVPKAEFDRLLDEKRQLANELESRLRTSIAEQEASRALQERLVNLENTDRENRFLKEEIQKHLMHELSSKELVKTLEDQLALTARSEDQLKMQTRQLMQQNQTLQADLLEKMAGETTKIQKMAQLSAEKQKLQDELHRNEAAVGQKVAQQRVQVRVTVVRLLLSAKRRHELQHAFALWCTTTREHSAVARKSATAIARVVGRLHAKALARSFRRWHFIALETSHEERLRDAEIVLATAHACHRDTCRRAGVVAFESILRRQAFQEKQNAWRRWQRHTIDIARFEHRLTNACSKLQAVLGSRTRASKQRAFSTWNLQAFFDGQRHDSARAKQTEAELIEAKDCVFALSRAKTRLEEKLQTARQDVQRASDQLREQRSELQLVKHGFVTTVMRDTERQWLRAVLGAWRVQTQVGVCEKEFRLQLEMMELQVQEREKYARSLDDYNKVLRNDLERFQFFSQDKRVAVDVLTKKLLREEDKLKHMEEQHVVLEEKMLAYKAQLASILEWENGTTLPMALLHLCRDATVGNLCGLFVRLATAARGGFSNGSDVSPREASEALPSSSCRLSTSDLVQFLRASNTLGESPVAQSDLLGLVQRHAPEYAETQGLAFTDFVVCLNAVAKEAFEAFPAPKERVKAFWSALLGQVMAGARDAMGNHPPRDTGDAALHPSRSPWAGQLSEDILQNQEKLLAVLEHETAVVERAVMEKSSLKHTYAPSEHSIGSTVKEFQEYQCDPVVPLESQPRKTDDAVLPSADCQFRENAGNGLSQFANWSQSGQVLDLFLAFRVPLQRVVTKYSNEKRVAAHDNQVCLLLSGVARMLEDARLYPTYLSRDLVHHHFGRLCDREGLITPQAFAVLLGCCALELFAKSLPAANTASGVRLSAREIILSFFCDLGLLPDSEIPAPPRICLVGADVETVLWPLYEYYALSNDGPAGTPTDDQRNGMPLPKFVRFAADIVNTPAATAERLFQRVVSETRRPTVATAATRGVQLHLDEFYVALAYLQADRCPGVQYANLGEAVRHWMQQTQ